MAIVIY